MRGWDGGEVFMECENSTIYSILNVSFSL
jgi:hypothetical protein